jgi:hypothetical protein
VTPLLIENDLIRPQPRKDALRTIFLLYEGLNTEVSLINPLIANTTLFKNVPVRFRPLRKTGNDIGRTSPLAMIDIALKFIRDNCGPKGCFKCERDKVLIVFDLDVAKNDQTEIDKIKQRKTSDMILCFTNPAIELFLLLARKGSYRDLIAPHEKEIIENDYFPSENGKKERFVLHLFKENFGIDPKDKEADFRFVLENIDTVFQQENMYLNHRLSEAANKLTSNIAYVLKKIKNDKIDEIQY